jgi:hypothetical protein
VVRPVECQPSAVTTSLPVGGVFDDRSVVELVRRNRAPLSRAVATLFVNAVETG